MGEESMGTRVGTVGELATGEGMVIEAGGRSLALFNVEGAYYAIDNTCPHRGGPLAEGDLEGLVISCPWHAWRWDVRTGANVNNPAVRVSCFSVRVQGDGIFVDLAAVASSAPEQGV
ncbi:MAG: non-heme iron oxygenase ferredoxin subunit [Candidatus Rokuibacteriota bacterium]